VRLAATVDRSFPAGLVRSDTGRTGREEGAGRLTGMVTGNKAAAKSSCEQ